MLPGDFLMNALDRPNSNHRREHSKARNTIACVHNWFFKLNRSIDCVFGTFSKIEVFFIVAKKSNYKYNLVFFNLALLWLYVLWIHFESILNLFWVQFRSVLDTFFSIFSLLSVCIWSIFGPFSVKTPIVSFFGD